MFRPVFQEKGPKNPLINPLQNSSECLFGQIPLRFLHKHSLDRKSTQKRVHPEAGPEWVLDMHFPK